MILQNSCQNVTWFVGFFKLYMDIHLPVTTWENREYSHDGVIDQSFFPYAILAQDQVFTQEKFVPLFLARAWVFTLRCLAQKCPPRSHVKVP